MTNPNVTRGIGSVERFESQRQYERPFHQDEKQFYLFHPPMPTENGKQLKQYFDERTLLEGEKIRLKEEETKLTDKYDGLRKDLAEAQRKPANSPEEEQQKQAEIESIQNEIKKVAEEKMKIKEKIEEKESEIDKTNEKINELIEIVVEEEHKVNQEQLENEKKENEAKAENLMAML